MLPFKKIMCPTDFSEPAGEAVEAAKEVALHFSAEMLLVHVVPPLHFMPPSDAPPTLTPLYLEEMETAGKKGLRKFADEKIPGEVMVHLELSLGNPADEIIRIAREEQVDLIVMATHGATGFQRVLFGSVAEKVVRLSPCPVLTIRAHPKEG
jgi:nucleotide-binding universal stress UspA family protein